MTYGVPLGKKPEARLRHNQMIGTVKKTLLFKNEMAHGVVPVKRLSPLILIAQERMTSELAL